jgi:hypothetical protein
MRSLDATDDQIKKALVTLAIEHVLLEIGKPILEKVTSKLFQEYHCYIPDCYEKPEYLNKVLKDLFGNSHIEIVKSINKRLEQFASQKSINRFLKIINQ